MAGIPPSGPGVPEYTPGQAPQPVGVYRHIPTGKTLTVEHPAAADALASFQEQNARGNYVNTYEYVGPADESASEAQSRNLEADEGDEFTVSKTAKGEKRYFRNGQRISKAEYDKAQQSQGGSASDLEEEQPEAPDTTQVDKAKEAAKSTTEGDSEENEQGSEGSSTTPSQQSGE